MSGEISGSAASETQPGDAEITSIDEYTAIKFAREHADPADLTIDGVCAALGKVRESAQRDLLEGWLFAHVPPSEASDAIMRSHGL